MTLVAPETISLENNGRGLKAFKFNNSSSGGVDPAPDPDYPDYLARVDWVKQTFVDKVAYGIFIAAYDERQTQIDHELQSKIDAADLRYYVTDEDFTIFKTQNTAILNTKLSQQDADAAYVPYTTYDANAQAVNQALNARVTKNDADATYETLTDAQEIWAAVTDMQPALIVDTATSGLTLDVDGTLGIDLVTLKALLDAV